MSDLLIISAEQAQERLADATPGTWTTVQEGWTPEDHNYSVAAVTEQGYVTVAPAGGADRGLSGPDALLVEIAPDLAHTVVVLDEAFSAASAEIERLQQEDDGKAEQIAAALALHPNDGGECWTCSDDRGPLLYPCPTARALGVTA